MATLVPNGLHDATTVVQKVSNWFELHVQANLAVRTGSVSQLLVLDADGEQGLDTLEAFGISAAIEPNPWQVHTGGGGLHVYFTCPGEFKNRIRALPGVDIKGENGYVLTPPSRHISGKIYTWKHGRMPNTPPPIAPMWLLILASDIGHAREKEPLQPKQSPAIVKATQETFLRAMRYVLSVPHVPVGERNVSTYKMAWKLRSQFGLDLGDCLAILKPWNDRNGDGGLGQAEFTTCVSSAYR